MAFCLINSREIPMPCILMQCWASIMQKFAHAFMLAQRCTFCQITGRGSIGFPFRQFLSFSRPVELKFCIHILLIACRNFLKEMHSLHRKAPMISNFVKLKIFTLIPGYPMGRFLKGKRITNPLTENFG